MSISNVFLCPERALVATDSAGQNVYTLDPVECSKVLVLPHASSVIAHRGHNVFLSGVFSLALQSPTVQDFDSLVETMPKLLKDAQSFLSMNVRFWMGFQRAAMTIQEFLIVGYSSAAGRMCCTHFLRQDMKSGFIRADIEDPGYLGCWDAEWDLPSDDFGDAKGMAAVMQFQVTKHRERFPSHPIGGRLLLVECTRAGITLTHGAAIS